MKSVMKLIMYPVSGLVLFVLALVIILAAKGKLNAQGLKGIPVVGGEEASDQELDTLMPRTALRFFGSDELSDMLKEARDVAHKAEDETARVLERQARIEILMKDLQKEKGELIGMRGDLDAEREKLKKEEAELSLRVIAVGKAEEAGLRRSALIHEAMDPKKAAAAIATLDAEKGAKLLAHMQEKKAARILQEMKPDAASELLSLVKTVGVGLGKEND